VKSLVLIAAIGVVLLLGWWFVAERDQAMILEREAAPMSPVTQVSHPASVGTMPIAAEEADTSTGRVLASSTPQPPEPLRARAVQSEATHMRVSSNAKGVLHDRIQAVLIRNGFQAELAPSTEVEKWIQVRVETLRKLIDLKASPGDLVRHRQSYRRDLARALQELRERIGPRALADLLARFPIRDVDPTTGRLLALGRAWRNPKSIDD